MRILPYILPMLLVGSAMTASAQFDMSVSYDDAALGYTVPAFPQLAQIPGYPVYYAPGMPANYFFYDGMFWLYNRDQWFASSWYNGPWDPIGPMEVPLYVLRVPVYYYGDRPAMFGAWDPMAPPRWGMRWGREWEMGRPGWDRWDRRVMPPIAMLPMYQREYPRGRYPRYEEMHTLHNQYYHYQPRENFVRERYEHPRPMGRPEGGRPEMGRPGMGRPEMGRPGMGRPEVGRPEMNRPPIGQPQPQRPFGQPQQMQPQRPPIGQPQPQQAPAPRPGFNAPAAPGRPGPAPVAAAPGRAPAAPAPKAPAPAPKAPEKGKKDK